MKRSISSPPLVATLIALSLAGCESERKITWHDQTGQGRGQAELDADASACGFDAGRMHPVLPQTAMPHGTMSTGADAAMWRACMNAKGWRRD